MNRKEIVWSAGALVLACLVLVLVRTAMAPAAERRAAQEQQEMMESLLPGGVTFTPEVYDGEDENITRLWKSETGYVVETVVEGYAGPIRQWTGVDENGSVTGLVVRDMEETLSLGREALTDVPFLSQFIGTRGQAAVGEDMDAITGATVTSKAIAKGVNSASAFVTGADVNTSATEWGG